MAIYDQLAGVAQAGGSVALICGRCVVPAEDARTPSTILKVCANCGTPLGEWATEAERDAELEDFNERVRRASGQPGG